MLKNKAASFAWLILLVTPTAFADRLLITISLSTGLSDSFYVDPHIQLNDLIQHSIIFQTRYGTLTRADGQTGVDTSLALYNPHYTSNIPELWISDPALSGPLSIILWGPMLYDYSTGQAEIPLGTINLIGTRDVDYVYNPCYVDFGYPPCPGVGWFSATFTVSAAPINLPQDTAPPPTTAPLLPTPEPSGVLLTLFDGIIGLFAWMRYRRNQMIKFSN